jgi:glyceraldehyde-3-phosphate dehydrogenase type I
MNIALNGFGRIGKAFVRLLMHDQQALRKLKLAAINVGPADMQAIAYMFKYDSIMGTFAGDVIYKDGHLMINDYSIKIYAETDVHKLPWKALNIEWVVDATGHFTKRAAAQQHIQAGAKKVLITAPAHDEDVSIIPGVNDAHYDAQKHIFVSLGSCTTNALMPLLKVIHEQYGIEQALMTTTHAYTNTQALLDVNATVKDLRRSRSAPLNIVPSSTGASDMVGKIMPELQGKIEAVSIRVPVPVVSLIDLVCLVRQEVNTDQLNAAFAQAAQGPLKDIMAFSQEPLVSSDYQGSPYSVTVDGLLTQGNGKLCKVFGWYDNEWAYSCRLKDFLVRNA